MNRFSSRISTVSFLLMMAGSCSVPSTGLAKELRFVIHDLEGSAAAWSPREVVIHRNSDLDEKLVFVLENPTMRTHVFEAPGLLEQIEEGPEVAAVKPLRVYVTSGEIVRVRVSTEQLKHARAVHFYQFFCPLHGPEQELRSTVRVVP
ncbi:hypothetical protein [Candidatus Nitrospira bockiana]